jgi:hypothetical protein
MIPLDSPKWFELTDAYGPSSEIPTLLAVLLTLPPDQGQGAEPYFSLWSALCHQGDIYTASYAAVPHIARAIAGSPERAPWTLFQLLACIEIARAQGRGPEIPADLRPDYHEALRQIPALIARASVANWDHWYCEAALSALAAAKGFTSLAEAVLELDPETIQETLRRKFGEEPA